MVVKKKKKPESIELIEERGTRYEGLLEIYSIGELKVEPNIPFLFSILLITL